MKPRVLVIGEKHSLVRAALRLGAEIWWAQRPAAATAGVTAGTIADVHLTLLADYTDEPFVGLVADLHRVRPLAAVVAIEENAQLAAAAIAEQLGLRGPSLTAVQLLTDKWAMRARLAECGLSPVVAELGTTAGDLRQFGAAHGFPFIAKPVAGTGCFGVALVADVERVGEVAERFVCSGATAFLMEEYLDGPELSVESFTFDGRHLVLALTDKLTGDGFVESGHTVPAVLDGPAAAEVAGLVRAFLDAVGLADGPSHVDVKLTSRGPRIVEGHSRRGGDRINELVRLAYGIDLEEMTVAWALGRLAPLAGAPSARGAAAIRFLTAPHGEVRAVAGAEQVLPEPNVVEVQVHYAAGDRVGPVRWSLDRAGHVIARGADASEAAAAAARNAARIEFTVDPGEGDEGGAAAARADQALSRELDLARHVGYPRTD